MVINAHRKKFKKPNLKYEELEKREYVNIRKEILNIEWNKWNRNQKNKYKSKETTGDISKKSQL